MKREEVTVKERSDSARLALLRPTVPAVSAARRACVRARAELHAAPRPCAFVYTRVHAYATS